MKIKDLLKIQSVVEKQAIPCDMFDEGLTYYSERMKEAYHILDLHLVHFIRAFRKIQEQLFDKKAELEGIENFKHQANDHDSSEIKKLFNDLFDKLNEKRH